MSLKNSESAFSEDCVSNMLLTRIQIEGGEVEVVPRDAYDHRPPICC